MQCINAKGLFLLYTQAKHLLHYATPYISENRCCCSCECSLSAVPGCKLVRSSQCCFNSIKLYISIPKGFQGIATEGFVETSVTDSSVQAIFEKARVAPFVSYDTEFESLVGSNASIKLVAESKAVFAREAGIWVPKRNEVWMSSSVTAPPAYISVPISKPWRSPGRHTHRPSSSLIAPISTTQPSTTHSRVTQVFLTKPASQSSTRTPNHDALCQLLLWSSSEWR